MAKKRVHIKDRFAINLRRLSSEKHLTQTEIAARMNSHQSVISGLLTEDRDKRKTPSLDYIQHLAEALGCDVSEFFVKP